MTVRHRTAAVLRLLNTVLAALVVLGPAGPAAAHTDLLGSSPAGGSVVAPGTDELMLSFAQEVVPGSASVSVVGPDGQAAATGDARVEGALVRVGLRLTAPGAHAVSYRVVAGDGHVVTGGLTFTVGDGTAARAAPLAVPPPAPEDDGTGGTGVVPWTAGAGALVLALAALHGARRRRDQRSAGTPRAPESVSSASCRAAASSS